MSISVFKPSINRREMHSVLSCLVTDVIGPAQAARKLVDSTKKYFGCSSGYALREYGRAIEMTVDALGLQAGDKVLISALAPGIYSKVFRRRNIIPVFVDVMEVDALINVKLAEKMAYNAKALYLHSSLGMVPQMDALGALGLPIVEDVSEAVGAHSGELKLGTIGCYVIMGMESSGIVTSGGGVMLLARDAKSSLVLNSAVEELFEDSLLGDINASLALIQWDRLEQSLEKRQEINGIYRHALAKGRHRTLVSPGDGNVPFSFPVVVNEGMKEVRHYARKAGIETTMAFAQSSVNWYSEVECPNARLLVTTVVLFPLYPALTSRESRIVAKILSTLP